ncbi:hypothetical protein GX411_00925, partial [Candidatus Fermentibacteria bacterium]|nr:hypothetical protein [Candidatus Fermentibacteria bacterium]
MKHPLLLLLLSMLASSADTPPDNNLPTIGIRINKNETPELSDVTLEHLVVLSWRYFDGVYAWAWPTDESTDSTLKYCESLGMVLALLPIEMTGFLEPADTVYGLWFRLSDEPLSSSHAFARPDTSDWDDLAKYLSASAMYDTLESRMDDLHSATVDYPAYWFFGLWDEANTNQRSHMVTADTSAQYGEYFGYWPDMYTQDRSEGDHTPTMEAIDPEGTFSWLKRAFDQTESTIPVSTTLGTLLTYDADSYPGLPGDSDLVFGTLADMGRCVRGIRDMLFTPPSGSQSTANAPEFICFNRYPFRYVSTDFDTEMGDTCWIYLIDQAEESMDSVVLNAGDMPVYFYTQLFGGFGGPAMRDGEGDLDYESLDYRQPSIAEFRMLCNLALFHQMEGVFPYCVRSFHEFPGDPEGDWIACSLLDWDLIPFDAPYEEWVYSGRVQEDVCSPASIPPFDGYDPLFDLPPAPDGGGERQAQNYNEWKFAPFANIWNGIGEVLAEVKTIGPEMRGLGWWVHYEDAATIEDTSSTIPAYLTVTPV